MSPVKDTPKVRRSTRGRPNEERNGATGTSTPAANRKVIFKIQLRNDIRKVDFTFNENGNDNYRRFLAKIGTMFGPRLPSEDNRLIKYKDYDNDMITVADNHDFCLALRVNPSLKFVIFDKSELNLSIND